jgi:hypothetical protein
MATSNLYAVYFTGGPIPSMLTTYGKIDSVVRGTNISQVGERILLFCDEVTLPGIQFATGTTNRYAGTSPINYPSNPIYNDLQLSFMCDAEMQPVKFLNDLQEKMYTVQGTGKNKQYRMNYADEYQCSIVIEKRERDSTGEINRISLQYTLNGAWPYSIDAVPLSYGSSQLVKVTANFYYYNWDLKKFSLETL